VCVCVCVCVCQKEGETEGRTEKSHGQLDQATQDAWETLR
jgi:hypothetical protein